MRSNKSPLHARDYHSHKKKTESNVDPIDKDTIEELNNLIGELDLFQKEHEAMEKKLNEKLGYNSSYQLDSLNDNEMRSDTSSDQNEKLSDNMSDCTSSLSTYLNNKGNNGTHENGTSSPCTTTTNGYSTASTNNTNTTNNKYVDYTNNEVLSYIPDDASADFSGYENPSFVHLNDTELVVIRENAFPSEVDAYNLNHTEVITLKCSARNASNQRLDEIERAESPLQRFSSFRSETPTLLSSQNNSFSSFGSNESTSYTSPSLNYQSGRILRHSNSLLDERLKNKPAANPRPASLSGLFVFYFCFYFTFF